MSDKKQKNRRNSNTVLKIAIIIGILAILTLVAVFSVMKKIDEDKNVFYFSDLGTQSLTACLFLL